MSSPLPASIAHSLSYTVQPSSYVAFRLSHEAISQPLCRFFPASATAEIIQTLTPLICPHDEVIFRAVGFLTALLPTDPESRAVDSPSFLTWLDDILALWPWLENNADWNGMFFSLLSRVASQNVGAIAWDKHLPSIFAKVLAFFELPIGSESAPRAPPHAIPENVMMLFPPNRRTADMAALLVHLITPDGVVMRYLQELFTATESFYHPSNTGAWSQRLAGFIYKLTQVFVARVHQERQPECLTPESARLRPEDSTTFVTMVLPAVFFAQYSKSQVAHMHTHAHTHTHAP